nr:pilus assembly protein PilB [Nostoc sp. CmiSLP01]MDZ8288366.1 pilus assembly protein PilB [Nostoc sp. ChiSLP01]
MLSSEGELTNSTANRRQVLTATQSKWEQEGEREQVFQLMDSFLSFEACLYHQILPFGLKDNKLLLGMVHPEDAEALDYVSHIASYMNSTLIIEAIAADAHRRILSAYLNHKNISQLETQQADREITVTIVDRFIADDTYSESQHLPTFIPPETQADEHSRQPIDLPPPNQENPPRISTFLTTGNIGQQRDKSEASSLQNLPILPVEIPELFSPVEVLATLPPKRLLEELLGRILAGGIGRLYLERQPYEGRILWSDNGVLQSVLDKLPLSVFQGVLNELKRFASLPITKVVEPKQVEKECLYQKTRLLLRLRVMPGIYGEEATLQVLRGAALKFYQQQQLTRLSRDALGISQQLSFKLHELQERLFLNRGLDCEQLEALVTLNQLVKSLDQQLKKLSLEGDPPTNSKS